MIQDWVPVASIDPERAAEALLIQAVLERNSCRFASFLAAAESAWRMSERISLGGALAVHSVLTEALVVTGQGNDPRVRSFIRLMDAEMTQPSLDLGRLANSPLQTLTWSGQHRLSFSLAERWAGFARSSAPSVLPFVLASQAETACWMGQLSTALALAVEALDLGAQSGATTLVGWMHAMLCRIHASRGDGPAGRRHAELAWEAARRLQQPGYELFIGHAVGLFELATGRFAEAASYLNEVAASARRFGLRDPRVVPWQSDLAEALAGIGEAESARRITGELEVLAADLGDQWLIALALRVRGIVDNGPRSLRVLEEASAGDLATTPLEHGRALLALGERRRRARDVTSARRALQEAITVFDNCGAIHWARRAAAEGRAAGMRLEVAQSSARDLTAQELRTVLAVSTGQTNREVATQLFLSLKTVEHHLSRVYAKLGVRNRAQLVRLVDSGALAGMAAHVERN